MGNCICNKDEDGSAPPMKGNNKKLYSQSINVDDFTTIRVIGRGTFGKVFLVRKKGTEQLYAMKVLKKKDISEKA